MIVMLVLVIVFVMGAAVAEAHFAGQPRPGQKLQRAVNRRLPDAGVLFAHQAIEILAGHMILGAEKDFQDQVALRGSLEALSAKVFEEDFLLFGHQYLSGRQTRFGEDRAFYLALGSKEMSFDAPLRKWA